MKNKLIVVLLGIFLIGAVIQVTAEDFDVLQCDFIKEEFNQMDFFDVGVGFPSDILFGQTRFVGDDSFFVTVSNNGEESASVGLNFILDRYDDNDWAEVDSKGGGPYDLDPDVWVESFFDVSYDYEGAYRATFSLDSPMVGSESDWFDDFPDNDVLQMIFFVVDPSSVDEWFVDDDASPGGDGSEESPFQTISEAISSADSGDKIRVFDGVYNEQLIIDKENLDISYVLSSAFAEDSKAVLDWDESSVVIISEPFNRITGFVIQNCGSGEEDAAVDVISDYNFISWNLIEENGASGIYLHDSASNNCIHHNSIQNNGGAGMFIWQQSLNNWIYHNDFINNNWYNVKDKEGGNIWNYLYPYGGNYWDDYSGTDDNGDGIGEAPYDIYGDFVPMGADMGPWVEPHKWNDKSVIKKISGPSTGEPGSKYGFEFSMADENFGPGSDPFEEHVYCRADWGDGDEENLGPFNLDINTSVEHTWSKAGDYTIKAKLVDGYGLESPEYTFKINIPRNRACSGFNWLRLFNNFPILKMLMYILR